MVLKTLERPATSDNFVIRKTVSLNSSVPLAGYKSVRPSQSGARSKAIESAVLTHIRALKELGKIRVNTREIAYALSLPVPVVEQAVVRLHSKGVKIVG